MEYSILIMDGKPLSLYLGANENGYRHEDGTKLYTTKWYKGFILFTRGEELEYVFPFKTVAVEYSDLPPFSFELFFGDMDTEQALDFCKENSKEIKTDSSSFVFPAKVREIENLPMRLG